MIGRRRVAAVALLMTGIGALGALGACGGGGSKADYKAPTGPAVATVSIDAGNYFFKPKNPTVRAGIVNIKLTNTESGQHTLAISGVSGFELRVSGDGTDSEKVDLKPGTYTFSCTVPGHRDQGMEGKLTVT